MASSADNSEVLNLSRQHLKKVESAPASVYYTTLLLDHNEIARLENVETYCSLIKVELTFTKLISTTKRLFISRYSFLLLTINWFACME